MTVKEVRPIEWWYFDPRTQAHSRCRYCQGRATMMVMTEKRWTQVCAEHGEKAQARVVPTKVIYSYLGRPQGHGGGCSCPECSKREGP